MKILNQLDSPALIGVPTAPTAPAGTNTTQVATTAFVLANAGSGGTGGGTPGGAPGSIQYNAGGTPGGFGSYDPSGTGTLNVGAALLTTDATELVLEQRGDGYGATRLRLRNRDGSNGAVFENDSLDLVDFAFRSSSLASQSVRFERRPGLTLAGNEAGEFQLGPAGSGATTLVVGPGASSFRRGALGVGATTPLGKLDVHGSIVVSQDSSTGDSRAAGYLEGALAASTDASWKGRITISAGDSTSNNAGKRTGVTVESDGAQALVSLSGLVTAPTPAAGDNSTKVATTAYLQTNAPPATVLSGPYASRPAAGAAGRLYLPTDGYAQYRDNGTTWDASGPTFPLVEPPTTGWSWVNQGTATVAAEKGGIYLSEPAAQAAAADRIRAYMRPLPPAPCTITAAFQLILWSSTGSFNQNGGLVLRESSSGKLVLVSQLLYSGNGTNNPLFYLQNYNSPTSWNANVASGPAPAGPLLWIQVSDDGTNRIVRLSGDGQHWPVFSTLARTTFITPDQIGIVLNGNISPAGIGVNLVSWKVS